MAERSDRHDDGTVLRDAATQAGAAATLALATGLGPTGTALTFAVTFAGGAMPLVWAEMQAEGSRMDDMAVAAANAAGSVENVIDAAQSSPERRGLLTDALRAATRTRFPPAVRAIGTAMAGGIVADDAALDDAQQVVEALAVIQRPHFVVMWALRQPSDVPADSGGQAWFTLVLDRDELLEKLPPSYRVSFDRLVAALEREGLVGRAPSPVLVTVPEGARPTIRDRKDMYWALTSFGLRALALLVSAGAEAPDGASLQPDSGAPHG